MVPLWTHLSFRRTIPLSQMHMSKTVLVREGFSQPPIINGGGGGDFHRPSQGSLDVFHDVHDVYHGGGMGVQAAYGQVCDRDKDDASFSELIFLRQGGEKIRWSAQAAMLEADDRSTVTSS